MMTQSNPSHKQYWADMMIAAESTNEPFQDIQVLTLQSYFMDVVYDQAVDRFLSLNRKWNIREIVDIARLIIEVSPPKVSERVIYSDNGQITVVVDTPAITDDTAFEVMYLLSKAMQEEGSVITLGPERTYGTEVFSFLPDLDAIEDDK